MSRKVRKGEATGMLERSKLRSQPINDASTRRGRQPEL